MLWSSQGLKDGPIVFLLSVAMLATLKLGEQMSMKHIVTLVLSMFAILTMRFYIFYMLAAVVGGAFVIGMRPQTTRNMLRQFTVVLAIGVGLTYLGVMRTADAQFEVYGDLDQVQRSRADLVRSANSGFGADVDVSTASGALSAVPLGMAFSGSSVSLATRRRRQSITSPICSPWARSPAGEGIGYDQYMLQRRSPLYLRDADAAYSSSMDVRRPTGSAAYLVFYFICVAVAPCLMDAGETRMRILLMKQAASVALRRGRPRGLRSLRRFRLSWRLPPRLPPRRGRPAAF